MPEPGNPQSLNRYSYVLNNPTKYIDPTGHWFETALDIAFLAYDIYDIKTNGLNWTNGLSLVADGVTTILPIAAGGGLLVRALAHGDDVADAAKVIAHTDKVTQTAKLLDHAEDTGNAAQTFSRTIDRAPINPKNYELRVGDVSDGGLGLSTISSPPVSPKTVLEETGRSRTVQIPKADVPEGLQWKKTPGNYGRPILDNNHWELWSPAKYGSLSLSDYVDW